MAPNPNSLIVTKAGKLGPQFNDEVVNMQALREGIAYPTNRVTREQSIKVNVLFERLRQDEFQYAAHYLVLRLADKSTPFPPGSGDLPVLTDTQYTKLAQKVDHARADLLKRYQEINLNKLIAESQLQFQQPPFNPGVEAIITGPHQAERHLQQLERSALEWAATKDARAEALLARERGTGR